MSTIQNQDRPLAPHQHACADNRPKGCGRGFLVLLRLDHVHLATSEENNSVRECEKGVITSPAHVVTRLERRTALTQDDRTGSHFLTTISLNSTKLRIAVASVSGGALSLFMCHNQYSQKQRSRRRAPRFFQTDPNAPRRSPRKLADYLIIHSRLARIGRVRLRDSGSPGNR